jgi:alkylation response protein AidB-like acyl-CoA dehydrogenase
MTMTFLLTEEQLEFKRSVRRFARDKVAPRAASIDEQSDFPRDLYQLLGNQGLLGLTVPETYGGSGGDLIAACLAAEELGRSSGSFAPRVGVATMIAETIIEGGTPEQIERWVKPIVNGECIPAIALTEPEAGSDALSLQTTAIKRDERWRIDGTKRFITNADIADVILMLCRLGDGGVDGFGAFLIEQGTPGIEVTTVYPKMAGAALHACEVAIDGAFVSSDSLLGEGSLPVGFIHSMSKGRLIVSAVGVGIAAEATGIAARYATERKQFGRPIMKFQGISFMLADMLTKVEASRALLYEAAAIYANNPERGAGFASMAKLLSTDTAMEVTTDAVQVLGGAGYTKSFPLERMMREAKLLQIYEGTNQIQRMLVARHLEQWNETLGDA